MEGEDGGRIFNLKFEIPAYRQALNRAGPAPSWCRAGTGQAGKICNLREDSLDLADQVIREGLGESGFHPIPRFSLSF